MKNLRPLIQRGRLSLSLLLAAEVQGAQRPDHEPKNRGTQ